MAQPNRLPAEAPHGWGGGAIDRSRPLRFKLDGRVIEGYAGDTLASALLANGVLEAGTVKGEPVGIETGTPVLLALRGAAGPLLPADRTPALDGLDLVTSGKAVRRGWLARLLPGHRASPSTLGLDLAMPADPVWLSAPIDETVDVDLLVVGAGVAGLAAANAARGRVLICERRSFLGGDAKFYGTVGDETPPAARVAGLIAALTAEVRTGTEVVRLDGQTALAHEVRVRDGVPEGRVIAIRAARIVLATGAAERLPVFAGNRLPGIIGAIAAYHLAERFGVWPGRQALISTPAAEGYRLGLQASDAGIAIQRIADTRLGPNSRFIDFCKASGVSFASGLVPRQASLAADRRLSVSFAVAIEDITQQAAPLQTERFVAAGGRQPDLDLWLDAGGRIAWRGDRFLPEGFLEHVQLAGAAAGYRRADACVQSGQAAAAGRLIEITDQLIDPSFETPPAPTPVALPAGPGRAAPSAFLAAGARLTPRPMQAGIALPDLPLGLHELAAMVQLGALPLESAGAVAGERVPVPGRLLPSDWRPSGSAAVQAEPDFLAGRFGPKPQNCLVTSADARFFEIGSLIFTDPQATDPAAAIGAVTAPPPPGSVGGLALVAREVLKAGTPLYLRDAGILVPLETPRLV
jgi:sarcosine oxidase subunit alpha